MDDVRNSRARTRLSPEECDDENEVDDARKPPPKNRRVPGSLGDFGSHEFRSALWWLCVRGRLSCSQLASPPKNFKSRWRGIRSELTRLKFLCSSVNSDMLDLISVERGLVDVWSLFLWVDGGLRVAVGVGVSHAFGNLLRVEYAPSHRGTLRQVLLVHHWS
jgi:hypothetical protein